MSDKPLTNVCLEITHSHPPAGASKQDPYHETPESGQRQDAYAEPEINAYLRVKYFADRMLGAILLVLTAPLTMVLFVLVKVTSPGPGFYRQQRVGLNGRVFDLIKLRSMVVNAESNGQARWCAKNDARITPVGQLLRLLHLDELPQLYNVMKGEMSLVGPRPERPEICRKLARQIDGYYLRNGVKPGITGIAQINLPPDETIDCVRKKQILDLSYIAEANMWLDIRILIVTGFYMFGIHGDAITKSMGLWRHDLITENSRGHRSGCDHDDRRSFGENESVVAITSTDQHEDEAFDFQPSRRLH